MEAFKSPWSLIIHFGHDIKFEGKNITQ